MNGRRAARAWAEESYKTKVYLFKARGGTWHRRLGVRIEMVQLRYFPFLFTHEVLE